MFDYLFVIKFNLAAFLILFGMFLLVFAIAMTFILWRADPEQLAEARRLIDLAKRANKGDTHACDQCNREPDIKKRMVFKNGDYGACYTVRRDVIYRIFGYST
ncbi:MAG: hypothetical protein A2937_02845 [Candidatus Yonathbacteria bacterium RIFCSPLOWO2_01_FULL_47_33b]|uniref:Uncharacterized protein n=1 Tax=Candidatus Yonathbacteria bacterium RIFCSPLOWO2_01_FULL_47_33b TaxID=1802727 RepID=A0A1G2SGA3_9BACT|nr:MAG: hypothetical protein A2937_02845 [Candidatus Yonathbacteria bacterium RIFCSPLOWO2_01_FULL_47_33b]